MKLAISIINWNNELDTINCVSCLLKSSYRNFHIYLLDNASKETSFEKLKSKYADNNDVTLIRSQINEGYAGGHKIVLDSIIDKEFEVILILNNDVRVGFKTIDNLIAAYKLKGDNHIYGGVSRDDLGKVSKKKVSFLTKHGELQYDDLNDLDKIYAEYKNGKRNTYTEVNYIVGDLFMVPLEVINKHGFMRTWYFMYGEELEYCYRLNKAGVRSLLILSVEYFHKQQGSIKGNSRLKNVIQYYQTRNALLIEREYRGQLFYRKRILYLFELCLMQFIFSKLLGNPDKYGVCNKYQFLGILDSFFKRKGIRFQPEDYI